MLSTSAKCMASTEIGGLPKVLDDSLYYPITPWPIMKDEKVNLIGCFPQTAKYRRSPVTWKRCSYLKESLAPPGSLSQLLPPPALDASSLQPRLWGPLPVAAWWMLWGPVPAPQPLTSDQGGAEYAGDEALTLSGTLAGAGSWDLSANHGSVLASHGAASHCCTGGGCGERECSVVSRTHTQKQSLEET